MSAVYLSTELEGVATFWRIYRRDGCTLGFTSHDRDLWFDGVLHRAAPGMVPSAIRRSAGITNDSADVQGALAHDSIRAADLAAGRFDGARFAIGVVDWETLQAAILYNGEAGAISQEEGGFTAELQSAKAALQTDLVPRTSPTCRAAFCGPECSLNPAAFTHEVLCGVVSAEDGVINLVSGPDPAALRDGSIRWLDGPHAGLTMQVQQVDESAVMLDQPLSPAVSGGTRALAREGCDHTLATCHARFANAANFRGEPFLPGNDLLTRSATSGG